MLIEEKSLAEQAEEIRHSVFRSGAMRLDLKRHYTEKQVLVDRIDQLTAENGELKRQIQELGYPTEDDIPDDGVRCGTFLVDLGPSPPRVCERCAGEAEGGFSVAGEIWKRDRAERDRLRAWARLVLDNSKRFKDDPELKKIHGHLSSIIASIPEVEK